MNFWNWIQDRINDFNKGSEADLAFRQGVYHRQQGNYDKAIEFFNKALELNPRHVAAYIYRGHVRRQIGDLEGAQSDYDKAFHLDPFGAPDWANMPLPKTQNDPDAPRPRPAHPLDNQGEAVEAQTSQPPVPVQYSTFLRQGQDYLNREQYARAIDAFGKAIELNPDDERAHEGRATAHFQSGDPAAALADYDEVLRIKPNSAATYTNRGLMHYFDKDLDAAILDFSRAIQQNASYPLAFNNRATIYREQEKYDKALEDYSRALDLDSRNPATLLNRGQTYALLGDHYNAIDDFNKAMFLDRSNPDIYLSRAKSRTANGDKMGAISDYRKFLDLGGADQHNNRAEIEEKIKELRFR